MKHPVRVLVVLLFAVLFIRLGNSCAYEPDADVFIQHTDPDGPYAKYAAGRLGIVSGSYRIRHLVVAYNVLSGHSLSAAEQQAAVNVDSNYNAYAAESPEDARANQQYVLVSGASSARSGPFSPGDDERKVPGQDWETFTNCLGDAFTNANATLADRRRRYGKPGGADTAEISDWIEGQKAVFSNCSGPGKTPEPAPADAPLWLRQDRDYQIAAAQFYALDYDHALEGFQAIAADHASPWSPLARYLIARVFVRKATVPYQIAVPNSEQMKEENARAGAALTEARTQLEAILSDPLMKPLHSQSRHLLDFVMARVDPLEQASELARRLTKSAGDPNYQQDVIDLSYIYSSLPGYAQWRTNADAHARLAAHPPAPLIRWFDDLGWPLPAVIGQAASEDISSRRADAKENWQSTHGAQWLVAALTLSAPGQDGDRDLMSAARNLPESSPAYASATYHRLRLAASSSKPGEQIPSSTNLVYAELAKLMPHIVASQPTSTVNQFADLESSLSPTLKDYLANATRLPVGLANFADGEAGPPLLENHPATLCGVDIYAAKTRHLDEQTALIFNQRMPLRLLKESALSSALPANVRFQLAHMAWTRALLLDDPDTARALSPILSGCQPTLGEWLNQYNAARTPDERHVLGLLALMRFTSTEPTVRSGLERDFAAYDRFRDNWWCSYSPPVPSNGSPEEKKVHLFTDAIVAPTEQPDPPFLSEMDRAQARNEMARLEKIPSASDYFAKQALDWVKKHPDDAHDADLIGFAIRVVRNACRSNRTKDLNHELFDLLHRRFPKSDWAARYTTWE